MLVTFKSKAFSLAELLIALLILGVIATFTIPKVLTAQANTQSNAKAKEVVAAVAGAYSAYQMDHAVTANTWMGDLTPYLNYVSIPSSSATTINYPEYWDGPGASTNCDYSVDSIYCVKFHSGAILSYYDDTFGGTGSNNVLFGMIDPDGVYTASSNGDALIFFIYYNGRVSDFSGINAGTENQWHTWNPDPDAVPSWFHWE